MMKGFVDSRTRLKINILRHDYENELLKIIDKDNLPIGFGGNCICYQSDTIKTCLSNKDLPIPLELINFQQFLLKESEKEIVKEN